MLAAPQQMMIVVATVTIAASVILLAETGVHAASLGLARPPHEGGVRIATATRIAGTEAATAAPAAPSNGEPRPAQFSNPPSTTLFLCPVPHTPLPPFFKTYPSDWAPCLSVHTYVRPNHMHEFACPSTVPLRHCARCGAEEVR